MDNLAAYALVLYLEDGQSYRDGYNPYTVTKCCRATGQTDPLTT
jgi:hypothetical protein